jgi:tetratricopeptide (TPR) repeat protein
MVLLVVGWITLTHTSGTRPGSGGQAAPPAALSGERETGFQPPDEMAAISQPEPTTSQPVPSNLYARLANGSIPRVSREQLEPYLARNQRSVEALLGALRASGDDAFLTEAKEKFPNDPRVQFAAAFKSESAEERQKWLEKLKQSDPDNALANYLLASEYSKAGQTVQALQEINAAAGKRGFENYMVDAMQNAEEAYQAGGYSAPEAKAIAAMTAPLPEPARLKELGATLVGLAQQYQQAGDATSAQGLLQMSLELGHRLDQSPQVTVLQELVGMAIERKALEAMDPKTPYGSTGQKVQDQLDALTARRNTYRELTTRSDLTLMSMSDEEVANYYDRFTVFGDVAAMRWAINKSSQQ